MKNTPPKGTLLVLVMMITTIFIVVLLGAVSLALMQFKLGKSRVYANQALHVAEAGVSYYRWALYHESKEYCNREACIGGPDYGPYGPYEYTDPSGTLKGFYNLYITPPELKGSTIVEIRSVGWIEGRENIKREIVVRCGIPSWSSFSVLANSHMRFGSGTEVWGHLHSNGGIRFDGIAHNLITSSLLDYDDPDHTGANEFGVHTHEISQDPLPDGNNPPENVPERSDVFMAGRSFPVTVVSFDLLDTYVLETLALAYASGTVLEASGAEGYHITLNTDDTLDIKIVEDTTPDCRYKDGGWKNSPTFGIVSESDFAIGTNSPPNGIVFVKDHVWVDGQVDGNRITILAFDEPLSGNTANININNDILYTYYDGTDAIGLIAQNDVNVGLFSEDDLKIDAALIAKEGRVGRWYYPESDSNDCSLVYSIRAVLTLNGALATRDRYGFAYTNGTGYATRNLIYDNYLTFAPPPHYPTTGEYTFISWREK